MEGYESDPRWGNATGNEVYDYHNSLTFVADKNKSISTIYVKVEGKEAAYYSLSLQLLKDNEREWWKRNQTDQKGKGFNEIILQEGVPYEFYIEPNERVVYQIHSKER